MSYCKVAEREFSEIRDCNQMVVACSTCGDPGSWYMFEVCACVILFIRIQLCSAGCNFLCLSCIA